MVPKTQYAKSGDVRIAYQVVGEGPFDLVFVPGFISNLDAAWEEPYRARAWTRLAAFARLVMFDKRRTGLPTKRTRAELAARPLVVWTAYGRDLTTQYLHSPAV
jgi:hypothetical protein